MRITLGRTAEEIIREYIKRLKEESESETSEDNNMSMNYNHNQNKNNEHNEMGSKFTEGIIIACFAVGCACISNGILKSWFGVPNNMDWALIFVGLVLCGISLFRNVKLGKEDIEITFKNKDELLAARDLFLSSEQNKDKK